MFKKILLYVIAAVYAYLGEEVIGALIGRPFHLLLSKESVYLALATGPAIIAVAYLRWFLSLYPTRENVDIFVTNLLLFLMWGGGVLLGISSEFFASGISHPEIRVTELLRGSRLMLSDNIFVYGVLFMPVVLWGHGLILKLWKRPEAVAQSLGLTLPS